MRIAEVFRSIQGEGVYAGTPSVFVRTTGCNLRCWFCDTPYTSWRPEGEQVRLADLLDRIDQLGCEHVVLTGGEPLLTPEIVPLSTELRHRHKIVTVETAGTVDRPVAADLLSISPKLSNSHPRSDERWQARHQRDQHRPAVIRRLMSDYRFQLKFVVDAPADLDEVDAYLQEIGPVPADAIWLMPQGVNHEQLTATGAWLAPAAIRRGYRYCPRMHIELFGNVRGT